MPIKPNHSAFQALPEAYCLPEPGPDVEFRAARFALAILPKHDNSQWKYWHDAARDIIGGLAVWLAYAPDDKINVQRSLLGIRDMLADDHLERHICSVVTPVHHHFDKASHASIRRLIDRNSYDHSSVEDMVRHAQDAVLAAIDAANPQHLTTSDSAPAAAD